MRIIGKDNFDSTHRFYNDKFKIKNIILIFDSAAAINILAFKKFNYRWIGLYRITESDPFKGTYRVSELDSAVLRDTYVSNRLKRFHVIIVLDVFSRYGTPAFFDDKNNIVNFADIFQEDLDVENLVFEGEDGNDKIKSEDGVIEDEE